MEPKSTVESSISQSHNIMETIRNWNFTQLEKYLIKKGLDEDYVKNGVAEYRCFLEVCALYQGSQHAISPQIDEIWHNHILFTKDYAALNERLGVRIHHNPFVDESDWEGHAERYTAFKERYESRFGCSPDVRFWPDGGKLGPCDCSNADCNGYSETLPAN